MKEIVRSVGAEVCTDHVSCRKPQRGLYVRIAECFADKFALGFRDTLLSYIGTNSSTHSDCLKTDLRMWSGRGVGFIGLEQGFSSFTWQEDCYSGSTAGLACYV